LLSTSVGGANKLSGVKLVESMQTTSATTGTSMASPDTNLMKGFATTDATHTGSFNFTSLAQGYYNVYVYSQNTTGLTSKVNMTATTAGHSYTFTINNLTSTQTALTPTPDVNGNWIMQTVYVGADKKLSMAVGNNTLINGMQIESTIAAVPEPGSVILLGVGGVFVLGLMKLRSKDESALAA